MAEVSEPSTRERLLAAAAATIAAEGWQAAGVRSVTRRAGLPLGSITYHFGGKEELFRAATTERLQTMFATPQRILSTASSAAQLVDGLLSWSIADDAMEDDRILLLEAMTQSRRDPLLAALIEQALAGYREVLVNALVRMGQSAESAAPVAAMLAAACDGLWLHAVVDHAHPPSVAARAFAAIWNDA